jgi:MraZ protein
MLIGQLNKFEIWSEARWLQQVEQDIQDLPHMDWAASEKLRDFSL